MKNTMLLISTVLLAACACTAQAVGGPDEIGLYTDSFGRQNTIAVEPGETFEIHLLLTDASDSDGVFDFYFADPDACPVQKEIVHTSVRGYLFLDQGFCRGVHAQRLWTSRQRYADIEQSFQAGKGFKEG